VRPLGQEIEHLTSREQEVLQMVAEGFVNKQIAAALNLSIKTVEKHRQQLMDKLNIHEVAGLTRYAIAHGVVESTGRIRGVVETTDATGTIGKVVEPEGLPLSPRVGA
jgi:DNA-binding CsgD family transcriptional regulator